LFFGVVFEFGFTLPSAHSALTTRRSTATSEVRARAVTLLH